MEGDNIRPEWTPSGYREIKDVSDLTKINISSKKAGAYKSKQAFVRYGFKRVDVK